MTGISAGELAERIGVNRNTAEMIMADFETARIVDQIEPGVYAMTAKARVRFGEWTRLGETRTDVVARARRPKRHSASTKRAKWHRASEPSAAAVARVQRRARALDLHRQGLSIRAVARELGVSFATTHRDITQTKRAA